MTTNTKRERHLVRRQLLSILILTIFLTLAVFFLFRIEASGASGRKENVRYISVRIEEGDTLWDLASSYKGPNEDMRRYIDHIRTLNHLSANDPIISSQYLIIPLYETGETL